MTDINKVLYDCCKGEGNYDWMTLYVETPEGIYSKQFWYLKDLLDELTPKRGMVPDEDLGIVSIKIDGEDNTFTCRAIEILDYMRSKSYSTPSSVKEVVQEAVGGSVLGKVATTALLAGMGPIGWGGINNMYRGSKK